LITVIIITLNLKLLFDKFGPAIFPHTFFPG
jgi:hypothetical protein